MRIPTIFHQTWKDHRVPENFERWSRTWKDRHPGWQYVFWTDEMNRDFIREHFSFFLPKYDGYPTNIERVDAVRYFVLYKYGGVFIDMDFECLANIEPAMGDSRCVFGIEPPEHCQIHEKDMIISNAFMGAVPGAPFFEALCRELEEERTLTDHRNNRILENTGPFMLSRTYTKFDRKEDIRLLDAEMLYPLTMEELDRLYAEPKAEPLREKLKNAYAIHHYAGTWWKVN